MSFSSNPNPSYNTIRGLTILISDIRNCTTKMDEVKRVESELDKIRKKFGSTKGISGYDKKKYIWKLLYIYILGYKIDFGHNYMADLITSIKFSEKMTGYISMSLKFFNIRCII
jgi:AP-2 complex subunit alpha